MLFDDAKLPRRSTITRRHLIWYIKFRKYMHAETPRIVDKTIVFSEHEVFKVVVIVTR
jgi:hypothetical protein